MSTSIVSSDSSSGDPRRRIESSVCVIAGHEALGIAQLAHAVGADVAWVVQLVEIGIVALPAPAPAPQAWRFESDALQLALAARRLERDFGVSLEAAALILDLQGEVRRLRALLAAQGLHDAPR